MGFIMRTSITGNGIIKWMFVFYVYQLLALSGIIFALVRFIR